MMTTETGETTAAGASLGNPPPSPETCGAPRLQVCPTGSADRAPRSWALVFRGGDNVMSGLTDFARREKLAGAHLSGVGAFQSAQLAFFDRASRDYVAIPIEDQVECLSLNGTIGLVDGEPLLHVHCVVGYPDGALKGGHMVEATVWPTLEVFLTESADPLPKSKDAESGLELFDFSSS